MLLKTLFSNTLRQMCHVYFSNSLLNFIRTGWKFIAYTVTIIVLTGPMLFLSVHAINSDFIRPVIVAITLWILGYISRILRLDSRQIRNTKLSFVMSCHSHGQFPPLPRIIVLYGMYITAFIPSTLDSASNRNEYQVYFLGVRAAGA